MVIESKQLLVVCKRKSELLELLKDSSSRMVLLLVSEAKISHVFAQNVNSVGVFTS